MKINGKKPKIVMNSPVVLSFVFVCFFATLLGELTKGAVTRFLFMASRSSLADPMTYLRLFTHVFGHNGFDHFMGNAAYLLLLGPILEEKYNAGRIVMVIVSTALITAAANAVFLPGVAICGASGVVFAFIMLASFTGFKDGEIPLSFIMIGVLFIGEQVVQGIFVADQVSNLSHILGGVVGAVVGYWLNKMKTARA